MTQWIVETFFSSMLGWLGVTGVVVLICGVVAWFVPPLRAPALAIAGVMISLATIYSKGNRDRAALEARRKEEAVRKAKVEYDAIDKRPDTPDDVSRRLRDGSF